MEVINPGVYRVNLPKLSKKIYLVFYASLLELATHRGTLKHKAEPIINTLYEYEDNVFKVNKILERRKASSNIWEYLVSWKNYSLSLNSWEPGPSITAAALKKF